METKIVPIGDKKYKIKRFKFGERNKILDAITIMDIETGKAIQLTGTLRHLTIKFGVVEPKMTDEDIENLEENEGNRLYLEIRKFNKFIVPLLR